MRAPAGGVCALVSLALVTVMPLATSWLYSVLYNVGATDGGWAKKGVTCVGAVDVLGRLARPPTKLALRCTDVPANCGPVPSGAVGSPTGRSRRFTESRPVAPFQCCGKAIRLSSRSLSAMLCSGAHTLTVSDGVEIDWENCQEPSQPMLITQQIVMWMPTETEASRVISIEGISSCSGEPGNSFGIGSAGLSDRPSAAESVSEALARPSSTLTDAWPVRMTIRVMEFPSML